MPGGVVKYYGQDLFGQGKIVSDAALQDYVNKVGNRLIPPHMRDKLHWTFVVVENSEWNASMTSVGLCFVQTGFLRTMENEAQLAAVLAHEITHALYEHSAIDKVLRADAAGKAERHKKNAKGVRDFMEKFNPMVNLKDKNGRVIFNKKIGSGTSDLLLRDMAIAKDSLRLGQFSVEDEAQADRVGLCLLSAAGYDPRVASIVWKDQFNREASYRSAIKNRKEQNGSIDDSHNPMNSKGDLLDMGTGYINNAFRSRMDKMSVKGRDDHPEDAVRCENLNRLVGEYYSNPKLLSAAVVNETQFQNVLKPYLVARRAALIRAVEAAKREKERRPILDKEYAAAIPKKRARLAVLTKQGILSYKGYNLPPLVDIMALTGKQNCASPAIAEMIQNVSGNYGIIRAQVIEDVRRFKAGEIELHNKDEVFAYNYMLTKKINDLAIKFTAAASVCDAENTQATLPGPSELRYALESATNTEEYSKMLELLKSKN